MKLFSLIECTDGIFYTIYKLDKFRIRCRDKMLDREVFKTYEEFVKDETLDNIDHYHYWYFVEEIQEYFMHYWDIKTHIMLVKRKIKSEVLA